MTQERKAIRTRVLLKAKVLTNEGPVGVRIRDISPFGAQISTKQQLIRGTDLIFARGLIFVAAKVAWATDESAGIEFYRSLSEAEGGAG